MIQPGHIIFSLTCFHSTLFYYIVYQNHIELIKI